MQLAATQPRILVVDDSRAVRDTFRRIVTRDDEPNSDFELDTAAQGQEGVARVVAARDDHRPYAVAFVDMHMPPGWDGLETIERLWSVDPALQIVICSSFPDYLWEDLRARLGARDDLLVIKKPFDPIEVVQCMHALATKWRLARAAEDHLHGVEAAVQARTTELEQANQRLSDEIRERARIEAELRLAQKLEAIGQLAAGVAHEINTPIQFVGDSLSFVRESLAGVLELVGSMRAAAAARPDLTAQFNALAEAADLAYLDEEMPQAITRMEDGVARVAAIVRSMKELAHNGPRERSPVDINRAVQNAMQVTANSYKYFADVAVELQELPPVLGYVGDLGQVFINLLVNAGHAIEDRVKAEGGRGRGTIRVGTRVDGTDVVISIGDTGTGIPEAIRHRIFDAFYTTKGVGRGTGQGLAITSRIVVETHRGTLSFDTAVGEGTTFHVRLPIDGAPTT